MKPLCPPDSHHLNAAHGWIELGNHLEANEELDRIAPPLRVHPDVLELRWEIYSREKRWEACIDIAKALTVAAPERVNSWIHFSYALHAAKQTAAAHANLSAVAERFPDQWLIPYNLACYSCQLGRMPEAWDWFRKAMAIEEKAAKMASLDDPDLRPLWDNLADEISRK